MSDKVVGYIRVASGSKTSYGHDVQYDNIIGFCNDKNYEIVKVFSDEGVRGNGDLSERLALLEMMEFCKSQTMKYVIVDKIDRLSCEYVQQLLVEKFLSKENTKIISVQEGDFEDDPIKKMMQI